MKLQQKHVEELQQVEKQMWQEKLDAQKQEVAELRQSVQYGIWKHRQQNISAEGRIIQ